MTQGNFPRLGCAVVVKKGEKILLGLRGKEPNKGKWVLPGGGVQFLESIRSTARREILEETGLEIEVGDVIGVYEIINPPYEHRVIIYWWATCQSEEVIASSDLLDAKFFSKEEVRSIVARGESTDIVSKVLKDIEWA